MTPAFEEMLNVIQEEIREVGRALCLKRVLELRGCTVRPHYAYRMMRKYGPSLSATGIAVSRVKGGLLFTMTKGQGNEQV